MTYKTSLDTLAKVVTSFVTVLFGAIIIAQLLFRRQEGAAALLITTILFSAIYFGTFFFRPINYRLTADKLIVHRPFASIELKRNEIKSVEQVPQEKLKWTLRTFGVGGLFGYWGRFTNSKLGSMVWYATRRNNAVLVETIYNKKILLTPDEPEKFVADYHDNLKAQTWL